MSCGKHHDTDCADVLERVWQVRDTGSRPEACRGADSTSARWGRSTARPDHVTGSFRVPDRRGLQGSSASAMTRTTQKLIRRPRPSSHGARDTVS